MLNLFFLDTKVRSIVQLKEPVQFFRSHRESSMLAVALEDFSIYIVDIDTRNIVRKFLGHSAQITDVSFSPDSRWLITSSMDCTVRTWDIPSSQLIDQFRMETACVSLNMSPTGEVLATAHVDSLGIFLWTNKTLYMKVTLKALSPTDDIPTVELPECAAGFKGVTEEEKHVEEAEFVSPDQINRDLITLSGLAGSRWQNILNIDIIRKRNKPKAPPKTPKAAPFFLPTIPSLSFQFDLNDETSTSGGSKILKPDVLLNLSAFGKLLLQTSTTNDFAPVIEKLKSFGPSMIEFEIKSLAPEGGGTVALMLQFLKCIEFMLQSNKDFELAQAYLGLFLKVHGATISSEKELRDYLVNIQSCHSVAWNRIQEKLLYSLCVVQNLKVM